MTFNASNKRHAKRVAKLIAADKGGGTSILGGIWHWVDGVASGISHFIGGTVLNLAKTIWQHLQNIVDTIGEIYYALARVVFWIDFLVWHVVRSWITTAERKSKAQTSAWGRYLVRLIYITTAQVLALALHAVAAERRARQHAVGRAEAHAKAEVRAVHGVIEREAASGYRVDRDARASVIVRLLDFAAARNPELRALTRDIATGLLDVLAIDNPILRITLSFLVVKVIDRLGIDKAVGALISDLLTPILGQPEPRNVHDVIMDLSSRLDAMETQWAQFMVDGGSQVEQAGTEWRNITSIAAQAAVVAFTVQAVIDPDGWAAEIADTVGAAANDLAARAATLFKG
jgi:hypothetical protein